MSFRIRVAAIASAVAVAAIGAGYVLNAGAAEPALDKVKATVQKAPVSYTHLTLPTKA